MSDETAVQELNLSKRTEELGDWKEADRWRAYAAGVATGAFLLCAVALTIICVALYFREAPTVGEVRGLLGSLSPEQLALVKIDVFQLQQQLTTSAFTRAKELFQVIVLQAFLPLVTLSVGFLFGERKAS